MSAVHPVRSRPIQGERLGAGERPLLVAQTPSLSPTTFPCSSTHICKEIACFPIPGQRLAEQAVQRLQKCAENPIAMRYYTETAF